MDKTMILLLSAQANMQSRLWDKISALRAALGLYKKSTFPFLALRRCRQSIASDKSSRSCIYMADAMDLLGIGFFARLVA